MPTVPGSFEECKLRARSVRGHFTRFRTSLAKACGSVAANPSTWTRNEAETIYTKVQGQFDNLMDLYQDFMLLDEDTEETLAVWETKTKEVTLDMDNSRSLLADTLANMDKAFQKASAPVAQQASALHTPRIRVVDTLKPSMLSLQNTPVEFRNWKRKLDSFFSASHLSLATLTDQQAYARQFLEADLDARIATLIMDSTPVTGTDSIVSFIEDFFEQRVLSAGPVDLS